MFFRSRFYGCEEKSVKGNLADSIGFRAETGRPSDSATVPAAGRGWLFYLDAVQSLFLFGGCGIVAFGWFLQRDMGNLAGNWSWLWLAGALLIYNLDRLYPDPADAINAPQRQPWRAARMSLIVASAAGLLGLPIWQREWLVLALTVAAAVVAAAYSLPLPLWRKRVKDVPALKNIFPATIILAALFFPAFYRQNWPAAGWKLLGLGSWAFFALLLNLLLCDLRDVRGDLAARVQTPANRYSAQTYRGLLWTLWAAQAVCGCFAPQPGRLWGMTVYLAVLIWVARVPRGAWFYDWAMDGMLFVPALQVGVSWVFGR